MNAQNPIRIVQAVELGDGVALPLPAGFGVAAGEELTVREENGAIIVRRTPAADAARQQRWRAGLLTLYGSCPDLQLLTREEREFDPSPRVWDDPDWAGWKSDDVV